MILGNGFLPRLIVNSARKLLIIATVIVAIVLIAKALFWGVLLVALPLALVRLIPRREDPAAAVVQREHEEAMAWAYHRGVEEGQREVQHQADCDCYAAGWRDGVNTETPRPRPWVKALIEGFLFGFGLYLLINALTPSRPAVTSDAGIKRNTDTAGPQEIDRAWDNSVDLTRA